MNCPPSVRLTEHIADRGSVYAAEGSEAHELCGEWIMSKFRQFGCTVTP